MKNGRAGRASACLLFAIVLLSWMVTAVEADCWYEDQRHEEGTEVPTVEPCLNCTCSRGVLLCYLRVCAKLPNPPPPGCILLHKYRTCCPELICTDFAGGNALEARSDPEDGLDIPVDRTVLDNACVSNGSIYGPGSAMDSSSNCEYCYCLGGKEICIKPKCLAHIEGCVPNFDPSFCCPIHYNCTSTPTNPRPSSTTTEVAQQEKGGCLVDGIYHKEGGKVLGVGHSACDNCYCLKGLMRCEPLSCAPPLLGCSPVIKPGECCAASYNCSGHIEIQAEPFYGRDPIISKDYAKLRKQAHLKLPSFKNGVVTVSPLYVSSETAHSRQRSPGTFGTTRHFSGANFDSGTTKPYFQTGKIKTESSTVAPPRTESVQAATTNYQFQNAVYRRVQSTTKKPKTPGGTTSLKTQYKVESKATDESDNIFSLFESFLNDKASTTTQENTAAATTTVATTVTEDSTDTVTTEVFLEDSSTVPPSTAVQDLTETSFPTTTDQILSNINESVPNIITVRTVLKSTDCSEEKQLDESMSASQADLTTPVAVDINEVNDLVERTGYEDFSSTEETSSEVTTDDEDAETLVASATLGNVPDLHSHLAAILNISKQKSDRDDGDVDYGESSLPPSLPNLRIIYFYPEDAVDTKKSSGEGDVGYAQDRRQDENTNFVYNNHFTPPEKTEGGFVPKEPPILNTYYENAVNPVSIAEEDKPNANCVNYDGALILHGQSVQSNSPCVTCTCFYGNIACQKPNCPVPRPGCRQSTVQDLTMCCPRYICDEGAPTVVLDRLEGNPHAEEAVTIAEKLSTTDPFRDVIRTEPAPNLQSLIIDMAPHIHRKTTPTSQQTPTTIHSQDTFSLDQLYQFIFAGENPNLTTVNQQPSTSTSVDAIDSSSSTPAPPAERTENPGSALPISLAGCNIYGRMYRVGRIISELSGPCLECKCTEVGVQCKALKC